LTDEGGYSNLKNDSGGATNYGITIGDVRRFIKKNATPSDVKNLTKADAANIYKSKYWDAMGCDDLPSGIDYCVFDYGVNSGISRALKVYSSHKTIDSICDERKQFLTNLAAERPKDQMFLKGWLNRVQRVRSKSKQLQSQKDTTSGPASGGAVVGLGGAISQYFHQHEAAIIIGALVTAVVVGTIVHIIRNRN
jgi:lysozyme family protein